jgi:16S rRNA processing protein RimM
LRNVLISAGSGHEADRFEVLAARAYKDRLVLRLGGIEDAEGAWRSRGSWVLAPAEEVPQLPEGEFYAAHLVGLSVLAEDGREIGRIVDLFETAAGATLVVARAGGEEAMIPFVRAFVREVDLADGIVRVQLPEGLLEVNEE